MQVAVWMMCIFMVAGCVTVPQGLMTNQTSFTLPTSGVSRDYVTVDAVANAGLNTRSVFLYTPDGKLEYSDTKSNDGYFNHVFDNAAAGAMMGAGIGSGMASQGASRISAAGGSATGGNANSAATGTGGAGGSGGNAVSVSGAAAGAISNSVSNATASGGGWVPPGQQGR